MATLKATVFTGNISGTNHTATFREFIGTASTAKYADLAEKYTSDKDYEVGTVLVINPNGVSDSELSISTVAGSTAIAGVVSDKPAYTMNSDISGVTIALRGRVPCKVVGAVRAGDLLVTSSIPGVATSSTLPNVGSLVGKSLETCNSTKERLIEVLV